MHLMDQRQKTAYGKDAHRRQPDRGLQQGEPRHECALSYRQDGAGYTGGKRL